MNIFENDEKSSGSKGLVFVGEKIVVYRRDFNTDFRPGTIDLPGGQKELNETPFETFKREVIEEFGLKVSKDDVIYSRRYESSNEITHFAWFIVVKLPEQEKQKINFGNEGLEYSLISVEDFLKSEDSWNEHKIRIQDFLKNS